MKQRDVLKRRLIRQRQSVSHRFGAGNFNSPPYQSLSVNIINMTCQEFGKENVVIIGTEVLIKHKKDLDEQGKR